MKKFFALVLALGLCVMSFTAVSAKEAVRYYDENGNPVVVSGMYYNRQGYPMFNANCYYTDADGNAVYVGGCRVYYTDADGDLQAGDYFYDEDGNAVPRPGYRGGGCCGW